MAIEVETGTGLSTANAYCDAAYADAYATDRNRDIWMRTSSTLKDKFLIQATDYIDRNFKFLGSRLSDDQALAFPRYGIYDEDGDEFPAMPVQLLKACCEYAFRAAELAEQDLDLQPDPAENQSGTIVDKTEQAGTLMERTKWSGAAPRTLMSYPAADRWLRDLRRSGVSLERA